MSRLLFLLPVLALCATPASGQPIGKNPFAKDAGGDAPKLSKGFTDRAEVSVEVVPAKAKAGETVTVRLTVTPRNGAWTYTAFPKDSNQIARNTMAAPTPGPLVFLGPAAEKPSKGWQEKPRDKPAGTDQYSPDPVTWEFKAVVSPKTPVGPKSVVLDSVQVQACDDRKCVTVDGVQLPAAEFRVEEGAGSVNQADLDAALKILGEKSVAPPSPAPTPDAGSSRGGPAPVSKPVTAAPAPKSGPRKEAKSVEAYTEDLKAVAASIVSANGDAPGGGGPANAGLWAFVATAAAWGLISLVTPCVFPMIPITVSIFMKQAHGSLRERLKLAGVYSLTIITVLGLSAFALLKFMAFLSVHPVTNLLLAGLFLVLALSLFGMYELSLPNSLQKRLQARQSQGGMVGTIFGALAFTVISFTCVAPFLGGFAGISAGNDGGGSLISVPTWKEIAGGLAFATAFAAPFFVLALIPGLMRALPKSGGWLDSVKVVMGFLELAAALKFLRTAELRVFSPTQYFTFDLVLGGWVAISAACGLYLLNVYRLPHDEEKPNIGVPRLLFALLFLGLSLYLAPALLKNAEGKPQRPSGAVYAWVEAFLLPESEPWQTDLKDAVARSRESGKPIFLDFTGETCSNCKLNEQNVFSLPQFRAEFEQFEKVQLYTDDVPAAAYLSDPGDEARKAEGRVNRDLQQAAFGDIALPLYVVLMPQPDGKLKVVGKYEEGKINDPAKFMTFLKGAQEAARPRK
jgi:thiol:disulfide interchange protein DsbD